MKKVVRTAFLLVLCISMHSLIVACGTKSSSKEEMFSEEDLIGDVDEEMLRELNEVWREQIQQSKAAFELAVELDSLIAYTYKVSDLVVGADADGVVALSGYVGSEKEKKEIESLLLEDTRVKEVVNGLSIH